MTVIVAQAHIGQQSNDIPFGHCKAPVDPSVPRAVFNANPLDLVAAAAALPPSLPSSSPSEYRLASKRKTPDDDRDRDDYDDDENTVRPKRLRADGDSLFGPLSSSTCTSRSRSHLSSMLTFIPQHQHHRHHQ